MSLADDLKPLLREIRGIPGELGLRQRRVFLRNRLWLGGGFGGDSSVTEVEIVEGSGHPPKVRELGDERLALGGLSQGSLEVGPITTPHGAVGITAAQLKGSNLDQYDTLTLRITDPLGSAIYNVKRLTMDRSMHWKIVASPVAEVTT